MGSAGALWLKLFSRVAAETGICEGEPYRMSAE